MNRFRVIDLLRNTHVSKQFYEYVNLLNTQHNFDKLLSIQRNNLTQFLISLQSNDFFSFHLKPFTNKDIANNPYDVLKTFPLSDKKIINNNFNKILNNNYCSESTYTGGSTGSPFHYHADKNAISRIRGFNYALWNYFLSYSLGDGILVIAGTSLGKGRGIKRNVYNSLQNKTYISGSINSELDIQKFANIINHNKKIKYIYAYPSSLIQYLKAADKLNLHIDFEKLKGVICTSEMLYDNDKEFIEKKTGKKVLNSYGANDGGIISSSINNIEFLYNGMDCYVENVTIDGFNELVLTNLFSFGFPFIRYRVGDIGDVLTDNSLFPFVIKNLIGRSRDFIIVNQIKKIHGSSLNKIFKEADFIEDYQVEQFSDYRCLIRIVLKEGVSSGIIMPDLNSLVNKLLFPLEYQIEIVDFILKNNSEKLKNIISHVS